MARRKTIVITGAASDIGRATATLLARVGANVVLVSGDARRGAAARDEVITGAKSEHVHLLLADLALQSSVRELARQIAAEWPAIAGLIHHGVHFNLREPTREVTTEGHERFWAHNVLTPFALTHLLKDALVKGKGRVVTVGSTRLKVYPRMTVHLADPGFARRSFSPVRAFYQSKFAMIQLAEALPRQWAGSGVIAKCLCAPGLAADTTRRSALPWHRRLMTAAKGSRATSPAQIAEAYTALVLSPQIARIEATYLTHRLQEAGAPLAAHDAAAQDKLWALLTEQVGG
jgi:NAD(P)-dependent dehydrogenase (short-subunit alcohol dehydrogenase family)